MQVSFDTIYVCFIRLLWQNMAPTPELVYNTGFFCYNTGAWWCTLGLWCTSGMTEYGSTTWTITQHRFRYNIRLFLTSFLTEYGAMSRTTYNTGSFWYNVGAFGCTLGLFDTSGITECGTTTWTSTQYGSLVTNYMPLFNASCNKIWRQIWLNVHHQAPILYPKNPILYTSVHCRVLQMQYRCLLMHIESLLYVGYGVAMIGGLLKTIGLFCKRAL